MTSTEGGASPKKSFMNFRVDRIISVATLLASVAAIILVLKKPAPAPAIAPQPPAPMTDRAQPAEPRATSPAQREEAPFSSPIYASAPAAASAGSSLPATPPTPSNAKPDAGSNSDLISATITKMLGGAGGAAGLSPDSNAGNGEPVIKDQQVTMDGDIVHGRFLTEIAGKDVWVTISGHMGDKDGYATFDPTEFKVGDMNVPVSLVNPALQRKLAEQRDRLKIPSN
ncbi:MAG TPA: hypothetical protein VKB49_04000 [Candidatus Sulfotelmatobacter sp.]|nr:hypothetical protein [Candidatus Sulfotelmatobacter sp.]